MDNSNNLINQEDLWDMILSEDEGKIQSILNKLSLSEFEIIFDHLTKMSSEDGWHPSQRRSALFALDIFGNKNIMHKDLLNLND